ncbi:hypothetical protein ABE883_18075 [Enterococcus raffinosus]|uniref:hypothetical protein n=1 Tax=Enterococcus TaxID=1350 RepID=UPI00066130EA|nr:MULTISPECIES: hypothetical protein [Enterococcus]SAM60856.1 hypothetical protein DTPHA_1401548 [Enterococcus faecium]MZJ56160.1 hypothetical protein [Enterococcus avium]MZJ76751.1 hypothetical protein [Enterococcus avium]MZJ80940.1 hypothetical protein [Enterococcus avium]MZJ87201.1 hypothetical protein [Enterococcus avium]
MAKMKFKLNYDGVGQLLKSAEMQGVLEEKATGIKNRAGEGYAQDVYVGKTRANAMVYADSYKAKRDNKKNNTLLKAVR